MNIESNDRIISFAGGISSQNLFRKDQFQEIQTYLLKNKVENMFFHSPVSGLKELKKELRKLMLSRAIRVSTNNIMVTSGCQQRLDLIVRTFVNPNDVILVEEPTFLELLNYFRH